jgi:hypothetical protein
MTDPPGVGLERLNADESARPAMEGSTRAGELLKRVSAAGARWPWQRQMNRHIVNKKL